MGVLGFRITKRTHAGDVETYYCICGDLTHHLTLWIPNDPDWFEGYGQVDLVVGYWRGDWRDRLANAWRLLRGKNAPLVETILNYPDAVALRDGLNRVLSFIEQHTQPEDA